MLRRAIKSTIINRASYSTLKTGSITMSSGKPLTPELLAQFNQEFYSDRKNILAQNVCTKYDPYEVCVTRKVEDIKLHVYNIKLDSEAKPVTNQESSGRCWLFAALNVMRLPFMKKCGIDDFEFSQSYLFFWDKIERAHFWLNTIVSTAKQGEEVDGRLLGFLLKDPIPDGGQWDMIVNLVNKYGVMPKKCFPESHNSRRSLRLNSIIKTKLREFAKELRDKVDSGASDTCLENAIKTQVKVIYNIVATCLGTPPQKFKFEYYNKDKSYHAIGPITPLEFYNNHVKPTYDIDSKVCLVSDPRPSNPFGNLYTLHCLGNVVGGKPTAYNNQPIEVLIKAVKDSIEGGEAVWFGCEVSKRFDRKSGFEDLDAHDFDVTFNTDIHIGMNKSDRLIYGDSCMTHAMIFTAVGTDDKGNPEKFRVENSYGDKEFDKGYLLLTEPWFREFVFEVVVDKKYVDKKVLDVFKQEAKVLPAWDPMGTLACTFCQEK